MICNCIIKTSIILPYHFPVVIEIKFLGFFIIISSLFKRYTDCSMFTTSFNWGFCFIRKCDYTTVTAIS